MVCFQQTARPLFLLRSIVTCVSPFVNCRQGSASAPRKNEPNYLCRQTAVRPPSDHHQTTVRHNCRKEWRKQLPSDRRQTAVRPPSNHRQTPAKKRSQLPLIREVWLLRFVFRCRVFDHREAIYMLVYKIYKHVYFRISSQEKRPQDALQAVFLRLVSYPALLTIETPYKPAESHRTPIHN